ncbi:hypothetical protein [Mesorhizobium sp. NBSH29]|uniref:hypothetical protein n=1 Tax=Mesorhizobium sp. NBSH29 TaxID=2654249 RepID=UPI001AED7531|nr:hypothetical protein [Mesorhizobium sp. NBSH29]
MAPAAAGATSFEAPGAAAFWEGSITSGAALELAKASPTIPPRMTNKGSLRRRGVSAGLATVEAVVAESIAGAILAGVPSRTTEGAFLLEGSVVMDDAEAAPETRTLAKTTAAYKRISNPSLS